MTTIIALCNGDSIYIGSDSRTTSRDMIVAEDTVKLIQYSDYIIGVSGIAVVNQTLGLWHKEIPIHTEKDVYILQESIISLMKDKNCMYSLKESDMIILTRY